MQAVNLAMVGGEAYGELAEQLLNTIHDVQPG